MEDGVKGFGGVGGIEVTAGVAAGALQSEFLRALEEGDEGGDDFCGR